MGRRWVFWIIKIYSCYKSRGDTGWEKSVATVPSVCLGGLEFVCYNFEAIF